MGRGRDRREDPGGRARTMQDARRHIEDLGGLAEWEAADLVSRSDAIGGELRAANMSTSQIRNFLDEVNLIWAETMRDEASFDNSRVVLLKPLLAYAAGRETDRRKQAALKDFTDLFSAAADKTSNAGDFKRFVDFTRAVVAYHRFHGGSNQ